MRKNSNSRLRIFAALSLMMAVFISSTITVWAKTGNTTFAGELIISGHSINNSEPSVLLDGENALSGRTVFSGSVITTSKDAAATVKLGKLGYLTLSPNSVLNLNFDDKSISGTLSAGDVQVFNNENIKVNIERTGNAANPVKAQDDDDDDDNSPLVPILFFAGIVTTAVVFVLSNRDDDNFVASPVR